MTAQPDRATAFHQLHRGPAPLLLANAWDAGSARLIEHLGAPAIATTSAGMAWASGYPDGDTVPADVLIATVTAIARVIRVPLSVDVEAGYADDPAAVGALVERVIDAGAAGINLEDGAGDPALLCAKIARIREVSARLGVDLFINARTDVYLRGLVPAAERVAEVSARALRYRDAGAHGLFVPKVLEPAEIRAIASVTELPLNVLAWAGLPPTAELGALGVRRLSAGSALSQAANAHVAGLAAAFLRDGALVPTAPGALTYADLNALWR